MERRRSLLCLEEVAEEEVAEVVAEVAEEEVAAEEEQVMVEEAAEVAVVSVGSAWGI